VAFQDNQLKQGKLAAAVAPIYKDDAFKLRMLMRED
jgi:hypothetical protein